MVLATMCSSQDATQSTLSQDDSLWSNSAVMLPMGNDRESPVYWKTRNRTYSPRYSSNTTGVSMAVKRIQINPWIISLLYLFAMIHWMSKGASIRESQTAIEVYEYEKEMVQFQVSETIENLNRVKEALSVSDRLLSELEKVQHLLKHELHMTEEMGEKGLLAWSIPENGEDSLLKKWSDQRLETLKDKIIRLQRYVSETSKNAVLERYVCYAYGVRIFSLFSNLIFVDCQIWSRPI
jgi:hypothetical protein